MALFEHVWIWKLCPHCSGDLFLASYNATYVTERRNECYHFCQQVEPQEKSSALPKAMARRLREWKDWVVRSPYESVAGDEYLCVLAKRSIEELFWWYNLVCAQSLSEFYGHNLPYVFAQIELMCRYIKSQFSRDYMVGRSHSVLKNETSSRPLVLTFCCGYAPKPRRHSTKSWDHNKPLTHENGLFVLIEFRYVYRLQTLVIYHGRPNMY